MGGEGGAAVLAIPPGTAKGARRTDLAPEEAGVAGVGEAAV